MKLSINISGRVTNIHITLSGVFVNLWAYIDEI
jgi:hypothetical protein